MTTASERVKPAWPSDSQHCAATAAVLASSPSGTGSSSTSYADRAARTPVGLAAQGLGVHERDPLGCLAQDPGQAVEQVAADHDVVRRRAADVESLSPFMGPPRRTATISSATSSGVRPSVSTVSVATDS